MSVSSISIQEERFRVTLRNMFINICLRRDLCHLPSSRGLKQPAGQRTMRDTANVPGLVCLAKFSPS